MSKILTFPTAPKPTTNPGAPFTPGHLGHERAGPEPQGQPTDLEARASALDIHTSCIVEAPAGSGKTGLLMQRYLKLLAEESAQQPEEVLAITFTNKATSELQERILEQLESAHQNQPIPPSASPFAQQTRAFATAVLERDATFQWQILTHPHRLNIRTIDSLCAEIANAVPLLSGSGASRKPNPEPMPLYRRAAQRTLLHLGGTNQLLHQSLRTLLLHRDANLSDVETLLAGMLAQREQWGEIIPLTPTELDPHYLDTEVRPRLESTLQFIVCSALTRAAAAMPPGMLQELTTLAAHLGLNPGYKGETSPIAFCADRRIPPEEKADHLDHWSALISLLLTKDGGWRRSFNANHVFFEMSRPEKAALQHLIDTHQSDALCAALCAVRELPPAHYPDEQWQVTKSLFHVLRHALAELRVLFAETNECDFTELALAAREALASEDSATDLALATGGRLRHLLVDEMQDTSAGQYDLIHLLTRSWDGATQTLFLVGDPKQSIYLFRQARVERFLRTLRNERLGDIPLQTLRLDSNFRSQATLVESFNRTFEVLFPSLEDSERTGNTSAVPFVAAHATREATDTNDIQWHTAFLTNTYTASDHATEQAQKITAVIQYWQYQALPAGRTAPWDIAVLARNRSHLSAIVAALKRAHIPYRALDIDPLADLPEVLDVLALTRALVHPADRAAWLAVLHAPWCGLGLADLLTLTGNEPRPDAAAPIATLVARRTHFLTAEAQQLLARVWPTLESAVAAIGQAPLDIQVERTWRSLGGDAPLTPTQQTNVQRYLTLLREVLAETGHLDLPTLTTRLQNLYAEPTPGDIHVELLTIHKAKGLEWDVVLVPSLERRGGSSTGDLLNWLEIDGTPADASPVILAPIHSKGYDVDPLNRWLSAARNAREEAERRRLFYVLCTRAREELNLFGAVKINEKGEIAQPVHGSLLKSVWPAAEPYFAHTIPAPKGINHDLTNSLQATETKAEILEIAAAKSTGFPQNVISRLPLAFDPLERLKCDTRAPLPYPPATALQQAAIFDRPEGSFAARAFGNVVHRYLELLADRLTATAPSTLLDDVANWQPRLLASLRSEGIPPRLAAGESVRAHQALTRALTDPIGLWILSPHTTSASEQAVATAAGTLRADRTFLAGPTPLAAGNSHTWIVDFKTTEQGSRTDAAFEAAELAKYRPQLEAYAARLRELPTNDLPIRLGLYYPLIPRFICW